MNGGMSSSGRTVSSSKCTISENELLPKKLESINPLSIPNEANHSISKLSEKHSYQKVGNDLNFLDQEDGSPDTDPLSTKLLSHWEAKMDAADESSRDESSSSFSATSTDDVESVEARGDGASPGTEPEKTTVEDDDSSVHISVREGPFNLKSVPLKRLKRARRDEGLERLYKRKHRSKEAPEDPTESLEAIINKMGDKIREQETLAEKEYRTKEAKQQLNDLIGTKLFDPSRSLEENINMIGGGISLRDTEAEKDTKIQLARNQIARHIQEKLSKGPNPLGLLRSIRPQDVSKQSAQFFLGLKNEPNDAISKHFSSELGLAQLAALGDEGPSSPCEHIGNIFPALSPLSMQAIRAECIAMISPEYFANVSYEQFKIIEIEAILADQAKFLSPSIFSKLTIAQAKRFADQLDAMDSSCAACSGFMADQLSEIGSGEVFLAFGEGINIFNQAELFKCPGRTISWLPSEYFKTLRSDAPSLDLLLAKMTPEQFGCLPRYYEDAEESPFYGLEMIWSEIGGAQHQTVIPMMSIQAIEIINPSTLGSMSVGEFALLNTEVKYSISAESFVSIPAKAIPYDQVELLMTVNTKLCEHFSSAHMQGIDRANISAYCASLLCNDTWGYVIRNASSLNVDFLALESGARIAELNLSKCDSLTMKHWNRLGFKLLGEDHPCSALKFDGLPEAFWKGINPACFASLPFVEELTEKQLNLVPQSTLDQIPQETRHRLKPELKYEENSMMFDQVTPSLLSKMSPEEKGNAMNHLGQMPPLTLTSLSEDLGKATRWTDKVLSGLSRDSVSKLSPEFLNGLDEQQLKAMEPMAAGGLSLEQLDTIEYLSPEAFQFLDPSIYSDMTPDQLNSIPVESLNNHLGRQQVAAIEPDVMEKMTRFEEIGRGVDPLSPDHPCLGIGTRHTSVFSPEMAMKYRRHCKPVLDSQKLNYQSEL